MPQAISKPEPWLRGPVPGVPPHVLPVFHSFAQIREDLEQFVRPLAEEHGEERLVELLRFHLRHLAGSIDRLTTYLSGEELREQQFEDLRHEQEGNETLEHLLQRVRFNIGEAERRIAAIPEHALFEARTVGRQRLPSTVLGLLVHLAEHSQRHLGQIITLSRQLRSG